MTMKFGTRNYCQNLLPAMNVKRLRALFVELYKTINKLKFNFMRDLLNYISPIELSVKNIK